MRAPYWLRLRHRKGPELHERKFSGDNHQKGCEILIATEQGAVTVRVKRIKGIERCTIDLIPWTRFDGIRVGVTERIYDGSIGDVERQLSFSNEGGN